MPGDQVATDPPIRGPDLGPKRGQKGPKWGHFGPFWGRGSKSTPLGVDIGPYPDPFLADSVSQRPSRARARYIIGDTLSPIYLSMLGPHDGGRHPPKGPNPGPDPQFGPHERVSARGRPKGGGREEGGHYGGVGTPEYGDTDRCPQDTTAEPAEGRRQVHMHSMCTTRDQAEHHHEGDCSCPSWWCSAWSYLPRLAEVP